MPAYNAQAYIVEAIESVLNQSYKQWELIVVDDGSIDSTRSLVQAFDDERIIVYSQKNAGVSVARNMGISLAKGEYITFLDADDVLPPKSLEVRVMYLSENPNIGLVDGKILVKDANMSDILRTYTPYYKGKLLPRLLALDSRVFFNVCYMFRKNLLTTVRFKEKMTHAEDLLFYIQLSSQSDVEYGFVSEIVYQYRTGHTSTMTNVSGLEQGYMTLLQEVKKDTNISKVTYFILKLKIMKIMFLSWRTEGKMGRGILGLLKMI
jgi:glycosyltransferase involved in cell wall biosynthesis